MAWGRGRAGPAFSFFAGAFQSRGSTGSLARVNALSTRRRARPYGSGAVDGGSPPAVTPLPEPAHEPRAPGKAHNRAHRETSPRPRRGRPSANNIPVRWRGDPMSALLGRTTSLHHSTTSLKALNEQNSEHARSCKSCAVEAGREHGPLISWLFFVALRRWGRAAFPWTSTTRTVLGSARPAAAISAPTAPSCPPPRRRASCLHRAGFGDEREVGPLAALGGWAAAWRYGRGLAVCPRVCLQYARASRARAVPCRKSAARSPREWPWVSVLLRTRSAGS